MSKHAPRPNASLESVREQLIRRGLPVEYSERSVAELQDHHTDLVAELQREGATPEAAHEQALNRIGTPRKLASRIIRDYQHRTLTGRWPLISFVLAPLPMLVVSWAAILLVLKAVLPCSEWAWSLLGWERASTQVQTVLLEVFLAGMLIVVPTAIALVWARVALRTTRNRFYGFVVCLLVAATVGTLWTSYTVGNEPQSGTLSVYTPALIPFYETVAGLPYGSEEVILHINFRQALQLLAPLAVGIGLIYRETRRRQQALGLGSPPSDQRLAA